MTFTRDYLYSLLPAVYQIRDAENGGVLADLIGILAEQAQAIEADIAQLNDNWFIETCEEWVIPYLGDLLGVHGLHDVASAGFPQRARVANTLQYRQGKGTPRVLRQIVQDSTGWPAVAVEFFNLLASTQYLNHVRTDRAQWVDVRDANRLELLGTPFETTAHNVDVRHIDKAAGKYNISNAGLFVWRLQAYGVVRSTARAVAAPADGRYRFDPTGLDTALYDRSGVPSPVTRRALYGDLEALRQSLVDGTEYVTRLFGAMPLIEVWLDGAKVDPLEITACDLSDPDWSRAPAQKTYFVTGSGSPVVRPILVGVDPRLGRLALPQGKTASSVQVSYAYGFPGDVGSGPYDRREQLSNWINPAARRVDWQMGVTKDPALLAGNPPELTDSISSALLGWKSYTAAHPAAFGMIVILDSATYAENLTGAQGVEVTPGSMLGIVAADWPGAVHVTGDFTPTQLRPHIQGDIAIHAPPGATAASVILDGLLIEGDVIVLAGDLGQLNIGHCTIIPAAGLTVQQANARLSVTILRSVCGPVVLPDSTPTLSIADSIVGKVIAKGAIASIDSVTFFGTVDVREITAGNALFTMPVTAARRQTGCVRFSYVPDGSATPRHYRCQPDLALAADPDPAHQTAIRLRLTPSFTSVHFDDSGFAQLSRACAPEIAAGAADGSEMGAFHFLMQPQREINLRSSLGEYLRFGLEAGVFFVS